jgi:PAS domain S-box-containing protein
VIEEKGQSARPGDELFYDAFRASPIGIAVEDLKGRPLFVNPALCSMLGFSEEEMSRKHCVDFSPPEDAQKDWSLFELLRKGLIDHYQLEKRFFRRDGSLLWGRLNISLLNDRPSPLVVALVEDITEKKMTEETLQLAHNRLQEYERAVEGLEDMIAVVDREYRYVIANNKFLKMRDMTKEQVVGRLARDVLNEGVFDSVVKEKLDECFQGKVVRYEMKYPYPGLGERDVLISYFPIEFASGVERVACIVQDITDRKHMEEALRSMNRRLIEAQEEERTRIARELHDDIGQRLALLAWNLGSLRAHTSLIEVQQGIGQAIQEVANLGSDMRAMSHRLHSSQLEYLGLEEAASAYCSDRSEQHNVEIDFHSEHVPKDLSQEISLCLFRVLQEAIQNAIKHSGSQRLDVSFSCALRAISLTVRDSGVGFDPAEAIKGRGLGLVSMKERLNLVGGELSIESQPGNGTTIHACVPLTSGGRSAHAC